MTDFVRARSEEQKQAKTARLGRKILLQCAGMECPCTVTEDDFRSRPVNRVGKGEADG